MYNTSLSYINRLIIVLSYSISKSILLPLFNNDLFTGKANKQRNKQMGFLLYKICQFPSSYIFGHAFSGHLIPGFVHVVPSVWNTLLCHHLVITDLSSNPQLSVTSAMPLICTSLNNSPSWYMQITTVWTWVSFTRLWAPEDGGSCVCFAFT